MNKLYSYLFLVSLVLAGCRQSAPSQARPSYVSSSSKNSEQHGSPIPAGWSYHNLQKVPLSVPLPGGGIITSTGFESMDDRTFTYEKFDQWFSVIIVSQQPWNGTLSDFIKQTYKDTTICTRKHANPEFDRSDYVYELSTPCPASGPGESEHKYLVLVNGVVYHLRDDNTETTASGKVLQDIAVFNIRPAEDPTEAVLSNAQASSSLKWRNLLINITVPSDTQIKQEELDNELLVTFITDTRKSIALSTIRVFSFETLKQRYNECVTQYPPNPFPCENREERYNKFKQLFETIKDENSALTTPSADHSIINAVPFVIHHSTCIGDPVCFDKTYTTFLSGTIVDLAIRVSANPQSQLSSDIIDQTNQLVSRLQLSIHSSTSPK